MNERGNAPCLMQTGQGFSLEYKGRLLYSARAPERSILRTVRQTELLPGTLVLCCSPCLGYGLDALAEKLPEQSLLLGCEADAALFSVAEEHTPRLPCAAAGKFRLLRPDEIRRLPQMLNSRNPRLSDGTPFPPRGTFRRTLRIDFSAGASLHAGWYAMLDEAVENAVAQFWKNRITLVKFGRRFSSNVLRNLAQLPSSLPFSSLARTVRTPLFVLGAGESLEATLDFLERRKDSLGRVPGAFILAVDAALPALNERRIFADGVVCEESQRIIASSFIGCQNSAAVAFAGLSSCPDAAALAAQACCFYTTRFDDASFLENLEQRALLPEPLPPLGSVGVTAAAIAERLRADKAVPIYISGLDFSYSVGRTHARGTAPARKALSSLDRLNPPGAYAAAFGSGARPAGTDAATTVALSGYADIFRGFFSEAEGIFDIRSRGLPLGVPKKTEAEAAEAVRRAAESPEAEQGPRLAAAMAAHNAERAARNQECIAAIAGYLAEERTALMQLQEILSGGRQMEEEERRRRIMQLLECRDYLHLHFPDGIRPSLDPGFLKRVRTEAGFFLKTVETSLRRLAEL